MRALVRSHVHEHRRQELAKDKGQGWYLLLGVLSREPLCLKSPPF
jgi:hypothetical protein